MPITKRLDHLPNIYRIFFRSIVYLAGYIIFSFLEHLIKGLIDGNNFIAASKLSLQELGELAYLTSLVGIFVAFLFFNTFWVIRAKYGPTALFNLFFKKKD